MYETNDWILGIDELEDALTEQQLADLEAALRYGEKASKLMGDGVVPSH